MLGGAACLAVAVDACLRRWAEAAGWCDVPCYKGWCDAPCYKAGLLLRLHLIAGSLHGRCLFFPLAAALQGRGMAAASSFRCVLLMLAHHH